MNIQIAYRYSGEDEQKLLDSLRTIVKILEKQNHKVYVPILDPLHSEEKRELFYHVLERIKKIDALLAIVKSNEKSEGMLMEIGCALSNKKKLILAIQKDVKTAHLKLLASQIIEFSDLDELYSKLEKLE